MPSNATICGGKPTTLACVRRARQSRARTPRTVCGSRRQSSPQTANRRAWLFASGCQKKDILKTTACHGFAIFSLIRDLPLSSRAAGFAVNDLQAFIAQAFSVA
jgi:hypothetical protein